MKKKIAYITTLAAISVGCFFIGRNTVNTEEYINIKDINGWEYWEENGRVFLEIEDWEISKEAYTLDASYRKIN